MGTGIAYASNVTNTLPEIQNRVIAQFDDQNDDNLGPVGRADDLSAAHSALTGIMLEQRLQTTDKGHAPDYPFVMTYVDESRGDLVVMMHAMAALVGIAYEEQEIALAMGYDVPIHITYGLTSTEAARQVDGASLGQYYTDNCTPPKSGYQTVCAVYERHVQDDGVHQDVQERKIMGTDSINSPCSEDGHVLVCYYEIRYQEFCTVAEAPPECETYAEQIRVLGHKIPVSSGSAPHVIPPAVTNVTVTTADEGQIQVRWNTPRYDATYYHIQVYENGHNVDRRILHENLFVLDTAEVGKEYQFRVHAYYKADSSLVGQYGMHTWSDALVMTGKDNTAPVIDVPSTINAYTNDTGTIINYSVFASDTIDKNVPVTCTPHAGSVFFIGTTTITCTATDRTGNTSVKKFDIVVAHMTDSSITLYTSTTPHLRGGDPIITFGLNPFDGNGATAGLVIKHGGYDALLTASYLINNTPLYHVTKIDTGLGSLSPEIGTTVLANSNVGGQAAAKSDSALIKITGTTISPKHNKISTQNGLLDVIAFGGAPKMTAGDTVEISARHSHGTGAIQYNNVTVVLGAEPNDYVLVGQISATYHSKSGDSGGPIFVNHNNRHGHNVGNCRRRLL